MTNKDVWHEAVIHECMMTEACYVEADPIRSIKNLVEWHIDNTEFHLHNTNQNLLLRISEMEDEIARLGRVNKEWEALWKPIDDLVRPITPLGKCVGKEAVGILEMYI